VPVNPNKLTGQAKVSQVLATKPESLAQFWRRLENKTLAQVAKASGLTEDRVEKLERRHVVPKDGEEAALAKALRCDPTDVTAPVTRERIDASLEGLI
jgi:transcriptional regulator with XRE-family HTH domain